VAFDALEFDEHLAIIDTGYDLAFLLMDLDRACGRAAANRVMNRYVARSGDAALVAGLPLFLALRAMVRAHVQAARFKPAESQDFLRRAMGYLAPPGPRLLAIGGLSGTGKSTLARALAPEIGAAPGALVLRSDEIRKRLAGVPPEQRLPPGAYTEAASEAVFATMAAQARQAIAGGHAVIADATFMTEARRSQIAAAAGDAPFLGIWLEAPADLLLARVAARTGDASDADVTVLRGMLAAGATAGTWAPVPAITLAESLGILRSVLG
jgi:predicted kinase